MATDSLLSSRQPDGTLKPLKGRYCLKLYRLPNVNGMVAFARDVNAAKSAIHNIIHYTSTQSSVTEEGLFTALPTLLEQTFKSFLRDERHNIDIVYAALTPNSRAYEQEKFPGLGVPPKTFSGVFSLNYLRQEIRTLHGQAIHVPSNPEYRFFAPDPQFRLMDGFVVGSGAERLESENQFYDMKYFSPALAMNVLAPVLFTYFDRVPIERTGVGGAYQIGLITEGGFEGKIAVPGETPEGEKPREVTVRPARDPEPISYIVSYHDTGEK